MLNMLDLTNTHEKILLVPISPRIFFNMFLTSLKPCLKHCLYTPLKTYLSR